MPECRQRAAPDADRHPIASADGRIEAPYIFLKRVAGVESARQISPPRHPRSFIVRRHREVSGGERIAPRAIPDDRELAPRPAARAPDRQPHDRPLAHSCRHECRQIQKDVPGARPTEHTHAVSVLVERAQRVELYDHPPTIVSARHLRPTSPCSNTGLRSPRQTPRGRTSARV